jgi:ATP:corrinoid adenosyltransferase
MDPLPPEERHRLRMQRKKGFIDAAIARATTDKGLLLVLTGNGKGKSSSAFGMVARAFGARHARRGAVHQGEHPDRGSGVLPPRAPWVRHR